jgi:hypothetical protein
MMAVTAEGDGPSTERMPTAPSRPTAAVATVCPVSHVDHQRDGAAMGEEDVLDPVTGLREHLVLIERDRL